MSPHAKPFHITYIALGSNLASRLGDPATTLRAAFKDLSALGPLKPSLLYATRPVGFTDQPPFVNAVARLETTLAPVPLLESLLLLEKRFGRNRDAQPLNGPRTLDLDLLLVDDLVLSTSSLILPHPRLHLRRFVLAPLCELAPSLRHPVLNRTIEELLHSLPDAGEHAVEGVRRL